MRGGRALGSRGFTLIELVAVIVILGILGIATSKYIVFGTQLYVEGTARQVTLSKSRFIVDRLSREIRRAIPYSIRISADNACLQFLPIKASGAYRDDASAVAPPISPVSGNSLDVVSWNGDYDTGDRLYIYGTQASHFYSDTNRYKVLSSLAPDPPNPDATLTFNSGVNPNAFVQGSPINRYFTTASTVYFCVYNGKMYRYESSSITSSQLSAFAIRTLGVLMVEGLTNTLASEPPFSYQSGALFRNSVVNLYLEFDANVAENMFFNQEVHIPNVP